jgi:hypothetical protein
MAASSAPVCLPRGPGSHTPCRAERVATSGDDPVCRHGAGDPEAWESQSVVLIDVVLIDVVLIDNDSGLVPFEY